MLRSPLKLISGTQLGTSAVAATSYTVPVNQTLTISACSMNNTTSNTQTVTLNAIPAAGTVAAGNEIISTVSIPIKGSAPTNFPSLVGQSYPAGTTLAFIASAAASITPDVSGYLFTL